jgi:hypothetical protein
MCSLTRILSTKMALLVQYAVLQHFLCKSRWQVTIVLFMIFSLIVAFEQLFFHSLGKRREALADPT